MYYIVQDNIFRDVNYNNLTLALDRLNLPYEIVSIYSGKDNYNFETTRNDVFPFGGLKMARISKQYDWNPGSQMNENHDYEVYRNKYGDNLLNYDSIVINFRDNIELPSRFFARPTLDTKTFTGKIFTADEWKQFRDYSLECKTHSLLNESTKIQISTVKDIYQEVRVWIVKGKVVTASQYKLGTSVLYEEYKDGPVIEFVEEMVKLFQLNDAFVMDIALTSGDIYKIIECNCINCAGFYLADMQKLLIALEDGFNEI